MEATKKEIPVERSSRIVWGIILWCTAVTIGIAGYLNAKKADKAAVVRNQSIIGRIADDQKEIARLHAALADRMSALTELRLSTDFGLVVLEKNGIVSEWNKAMEKWTGYTSAEMIGRDMSAIMSSEASAAHSTGFAEALSGDAIPGETIILKCDLQPRDRSQSALPVRVSARIVQAHNGNEPYAIALICKESSIREVE